MVKKKVTHIEIPSKLYLLLSRKCF